jgi:hypothetical protein
MGLKGYRLWAMGQLDSTCRAPPHDGVQRRVRGLVPGVAAQVQFDTSSKLWKPGDGKE